MACKCIDKWEADIVKKIEVDGCPVRAAPSNTQERKSP
jgi:hypothetical protein